MSSDLYRKVTFLYEKSKAVPLGAMEALGDALQEG